MLTVALTGGIATGKSYVRARMSAHGVPSVDADSLVHLLMAGESDLSSAIALRFGRQVLRPQGGVNRPALGAIVFADPGARRDLEAIVHPRIYQHIDEWLDARRREGCPWVMADIPLLFETGREGHFDRLVVASCDPEEQVRRIVRRDQLTEDEARARLAAQWPIAEKVRRATDVIDTGGTFAETDRQIDRLWASLEFLARPVGLPESR